MSQRAMFTAVSGLRNQQVQLDVIANNVANASTMGYKRGRMTFEEGFTLMLQGASRPPGDQGGVNPLQIGNGSSVGSIDNIFVQGNLQSTGNQTDLALRGDGFFVVNDGNRDFYTRAGSFQWDSNGRLVIPFNGMKVQGRIADSAGVVSDGSPIGDIIVPFGTVDPAKTTSNVNFVGNLDADAQPVGNITKTDRLYSKEIVGNTTDINGLYANGNADLQITGMSPMSTTVTVLSSANAAGLAKTETYTYVTTDTGASSKDFHNLDDLIAEINSDFSAEYLTAVLNDRGAIEFTNNGGANNVLTLSSVNSVLNKAMSLANGVVGDKTTDEFSHVAVDTDELTTLRNSSGTDLGMALADVIYVSGRVGGVEIDSVEGGLVDPFEVNVDDGTGNSITFGDFTYRVKDAFDITNVKGVEIDPTTGALIINADGGLLNEITAANITTDAVNLGGGAQVFDSVFDATVGNWGDVQKAEDVVHAASIRVFDSLGNAHTSTVIFKKDVRLPNRWNWNITVPEPAELSGGYEGTVTFDSNGTLEAFTYSQGASSYTFDSKTGASVPVDIVLNFGTIGLNDGITQYSTSSTAIAKDQNGYSAGVLDNVTIDETGTITGLFTNGNSRIIAKLILSTFNNPSGLLKVGDNTFDVSGNSGLPIYGFAGKSIRATITPGAVELSNVDIAEEFTNMIIAQRSFQANARTVTTSDEVMQETVNMKR
ncbi:flagellar hook-basal body complex protein [Candidatus Latescibacterota bacterium]